MGLAMWRWAEPYRGKLEPPLTAWVEELPAKLRVDPDWHRKIEALLAAVRTKLAQKLGPLNPRAFFVEWPQIRSGAVGHAAAVRGDVSALAYCCGAMCEMMRALGPRTECALLPVSEWKGQLPKAVVNKRIARAIGTEDKCGESFDSHAWDAVGVGLVGKGYRLDDPAHFGRKA